MSSSSVGPFNNTYNFLFHPIQSTPAGKSKDLRVFASIAIGLLTLGASHIAIGLIHKVPEWASRINASLSGNQAKTAYLVRDVATKTLTPNINLMTERRKELSTSLDNIKRLRGPLLVKELTTWINNLQNFEEGLENDLTIINKTLSSDEKNRYTNLQATLRTLKNHLTELQSKEEKYNESDPQSISEDISNLNRNVMECLDAMYAFTFSDKA